VEYKRPVEAYPLHDFYKICRICTSFKDALAIKVSSDLLKGSWSYGGFNLMRSGYPQIFSALAAKLCVRPSNVLEVQERARGPLSSYQVWCGSNFTRRRVGEKTLSFSSVRHAFLSVTLCLFVTLMNVKVCSPDFAMKPLECRNDFDAVG